MLSSARSSVRGIENLSSDEERSFEINPALMAEGQGNQPDVGALIFDLRTPACQSGRPEYTRDPPDSPVWIEGVAPWQPAAKFVTRGPSLATTSATPITRPSAARCRISSA